MLQKIDTRVMNGIQISNLNDLPSSQGLTSIFCGNGNTTNCHIWIVIGIVEEICSGVLMKEKWLTNTGSKLEAVFVGEVGSSNFTSLQYSSRAMPREGVWRYWEATRINFFGGESASSNDRKKRRVTWNNWSAFGRKKAQQILLAFGK